MKLLPVGLSLFVVLLLSSSGLSTLAIAAERPTNPAQLLVWFLSLNTSREQAERPKIDVNSATAEALTGVPGLDRRQALRIIAHRPYATLQDLVRAGLSTRFIERLTALLTVESNAVDRATQPSAAPAAATREMGATR
jgi:DNA uptake protein ComE-like DNA-binding protein